MPHKRRYIRIDMEYNMDINSFRLFAITDNIKRILAEDMPYVKILFVRDSPDLEGLDNMVRAKKRIDIPNPTKHEMGQ